MRNFSSANGSRYFGWERQPGRDTIQGKLEAVLTRMCGTDVQVIGAGRPDAGVHAGHGCQRLHEHTENAGGDPRLHEPIPAGRYLRTGGKLAADRFRRFGKLYLHLLVGDTKPVFKNTSPCSITICRHVLTGEHDYKSFCSNPQMKKIHRRIVDPSRSSSERLYLFQLPWHGLFTEHGAHPDRTLLEVGQGKRTPKASGRRSKRKTDAGRVHRASRAVPDAGWIIKGACCKAESLLRICNCGTTFSFASPKENRLGFLESFLRNQDQFKNSDTVLEGVVGADAYIGPAECAVFMEIFSEFVDSKRAQSRRPRPSTYWASEANLLQRDRHRPLPANCLANF